MRRQRDHKPRSLADVRRLIDPRDVVYHVGNAIYKRSLRYTMLTAGVALLGLLAGVVPGVSGLSVKQALALPLAVGTLSLTLGLALKVIPSLLSARMIQLAQAADLNLMEDYRKTGSDRQLEILWNRVFRYEVDYQTWRLPADPPCPHASVRAPREAFLRAARYALATPMPQPRQRHEVGLDLSLLEDWRDGALFDRTDRKLLEQFDAHPALTSARRATRCGLAQTAHRLALRTGQKFWLTMTTRAMAINVGNAVRRLNRQFDTEAFNAQALLWPGEESQPWITSMDSAAEALRQHRRRVVQRVFGQSAHDAETMVDRMWLASVELATLLRMDFDPEYCTGELHESLLDDVEFLACTQEDVLSAKRFSNEVAQRMRHFDDALARYLPELLDDDHRQQRRAVHIAFHADMNHMRRYLRHTLAGRPHGWPKLRQRIESAIEHAEAISRRLVLVRQHQALALLTLSDYADLVSRLGYDDQDVLSEEPAGLE